MKNAFRTIYLRPKFSQSLSRIQNNFLPDGAPKNRHIMYAQITCTKTAYSPLHSYKGKSAKSDAIKHFSFKYFTLRFPSEKKKKTNKNKKSSLEVDPDNFPKFGKIFTIYFKRTFLLYPVNFKKNGRKWYVSSDTKICTALYLTFLDRISLYYYRSIKRNMEINTFCFLSKNESVQISLSI